MNRKQYNELKAKIESLEKQINGGAGSGNWGHAGRPGEIGGSAPSGVSAGKSKTAEKRAYDHLRNNYLELGFDPNMVDTDFADDKAMTIFSSLESSDILNLVEDKVKADDIYYDLESGILKYYKEGRDNPANLIAYMQRVNHETNEAVNTVMEYERNIARASQYPENAAKDFLSASRELRDYDSSAARESLDKAETLIERHENDSEGFSKFAKVARKRIDALRQVVDDYDKLSEKVWEAPRSDKIIQDPSKKTNSVIEKTSNGGKGSGNFGHAGRPGKIGGSAPEGTSSETGQNVSYEYKAKDHKGRPVYMVTVPEDTGFSPSNMGSEDGKIMIRTTMSDEDARDTIKALFEVGMTKTDSIKAKADGFEVDRIGSDRDYEQSFLDASDAQIAISHLGDTVERMIKDLQKGSSGGLYGQGDRLTLPEEKYRQELSLAQRAVSVLKDDKNMPVKAIKKLETQIDVIDRAYQTVSRAADRTIINPAATKVRRDMTDMFDNPKTREQAQEEMMDFKPKNSYRPKMNRETYNALIERIESLEKTINGGKGSGNFGHSGRPGEVGGSSASGSGYTPKHKKDQRIQTAIEKSIASQKRLQDEAKTVREDIETRIGQKMAEGEEYSALDVAYKARFRTFHGEDGTEYTYDKKTGIITTFDSKTGEEIVVVK